MSEFLQKVKRTVHVKTSLSVSSKKFSSYFLIIGVIADTLHRGITKRRTSSHLSTDHELEDQVNEWANTTGFLCALGSVCLQNKITKAS